MMFTEKLDVSIHPSWEDEIGPRHFLLDPQRKCMVIGRASDTNLERAPRRDNASFKSPVISRLHAEMTWDAPARTLYLKDTGSMHGTTLNGIRLRQHEDYALADKDSVVLGSTITTGSSKFEACPMQIRMTVTSHETLPTIIDLDEDVTFNNATECELSEPSISVAKATVRSKFMVPDSDSEEEASDVEEDRETGPDEPNQFFSAASPEQQAEMPIASPSQKINVVVEDSVDSYGNDILDDISIEILNGISTDLGISDNAASQSSLDTNAESADAAVGSVSPPTSVWDEREERAPIDKPVNWQRSGELHKKRPMEEGLLGSTATANERASQLESLIQALYDTQPSLNSTFHNNPDSLCCMTSSSNRGAKVRRGDILNQPKSVRDAIKAKANSSEDYLEFVADLSADSETFAIHDGSADGKKRKSPVADDSQASERHTEIVNASNERPTKRAKFNAVEMKDASTAANYTNVRTSQNKPTSPVKNFILGALVGGAGVFAGLLALPESFFA